MLRKHSKNLLCTFTFNKGIGGHYFSMLSLLGMSVFEDADILEIGYNKSPILSSLNSYKFINFSFLNFFSVLTDLKKSLIACESINIFCFDVYSYSLVKLLLSKNNNNSITLVKCGGPNPTLYYPKVDNLICFSKENYQFFKQQSPATLVSLIPNRVSRGKLLASQVNDSTLEGLIGIKLLCIARIGNEYKNKFLLANELKNSLLKFGEKCTLICIGTVDDTAVFSELKGMLKKDVLWLTESKYTNNASNYISAVDIVIGTGRGAVESLFLNKVTFTPVNNNTGLVDINSSNYNDLVENNFSGRTLLTISNDTLSPSSFAKPSDNVIEKIITLYSTEAGNLKYEHHIEQCKNSDAFSKVNKVTFLLYFTYSTLRERSIIFSKVVYPCLKFLNRIVRTVFK